MNIALIAWWLAPVLGLLSAVLSVFVADKDMSVLQSYKDVIPTLYFLAASASAIACAEAAELLYHFDKDRHSPDIAHRTGFGLATSSIVMAVGLSIVYAKMAALASGKQFLATRGKLFISLICGCASVSPGFAIKVNLELVRQ